MMVQKDNFKVGELVTPSGRVLNTSETARYNTYTSDINKMVRKGNLSAVRLLKAHRREYFLLIEEEYVTRIKEIRDLLFGEVA